MDNKQKEALAGLLEKLGLDEEPFGMFYTDTEPAEGFAPKPAPLPTKEDEDAGNIDFGAVFGKYSCMIGHIWRARKKRKAAYFDWERFGCMGGAFYMGYLKPQLDMIVSYVSTGVPRKMPGELYFDSFRACRDFFDFIDPRPAPARYCVFKPLSLFEEDEKPEVIIFFARPESLSGLHQLAMFVTNDLTAVASPFGAGCTNLVTWPLRYLAEGTPKAVLGGWDPSCRKFFKTDELSFAVPPGMFENMLARYGESFLTTKTWEVVQKKIERSRKVWGEA